MQPNQWQQPYPYNGPFQPQPTGFQSQQTGFQPQQIGFQPQQTGFQPQQTGFQPGNPGGSFMPNQPTGFQQPMQTGFNPQQQRPSSNLSFLNQPPQQSSFRPSPQRTGYPGGGASGLMPQQTGFPAGGGMMSQPTGIGAGGGMISQPTGMGMGGLRSQPTGMHDPRLQTMIQSFMPSNLSQPFAPSGAPQFNPTPQHQPLSQTFQTLLSNPSIKTPKVPWTLSRQEKKDYDQIFRAWDTDGDGFMTGETAREVFGQAGLHQDSLMKIWNLSDVDNRGKLNLPEFHVAMGLIYRALNGNDIPDTLPEELIPASMRDIDTTVNFMRDLLKHDASTRSNTSSPGFGGTPVPAAQSKDATMYKHDDSRGATYKPSSRHLDRKSVRYAGEDSNAEIGDIRRQLQNTSALLDRTNEEHSRKSAEDEALEQEVDDLKYRVKRIQEDIEYVSKGRKSSEKGEERRKLERELLFLMHEKLPELERRQQQREDERRMEERAGVRARDKRNETLGRYGRDERDERDERDDRDWLRGTYDRERSRERDYYRRDSRSGDRDSRSGDRDIRGGGRDYDRERDYDSYRDRSRDRNVNRDYRPRSPPQVRSQPPAPPPVPAATASAPPPLPAPTSQAAAAPSTKNMTAEERTAFIREQAQRRIQDRLKALGVEAAPADQPAVDKSVEERLEREKQEAAEKAKTAEREQEAREQARQVRLADAGGMKEDNKLSSPQPPTDPPKSAVKQPKPAPTPPAPRNNKQAPVPPAPRPGAPAPPKPHASAAATSPSFAEDPEEVEIRRKEEAMAKAKEERRKRLQELERQEEEERKEEERIAARSKPREQVSPALAVSPPSEASPAPPAPGYNPFRKPAVGAAATPSPAAGGFNPFFKPQTPAPAQPSVSPGTEIPPPPPPPPATDVSTTSSAAEARNAFSPPQQQDDWEQIEEKEVNESDSSDEDYSTTRASRGALASALFGNITSPTGSRPGSAAPAAPSASKALPPAVKNLGGGDPNAGRGALLSSIAGAGIGGLRKAKTVDRSAPPVSGRVVGDTAPPAPIYTTAPSSPPTPVDDESSSRSNPNRQSVDWYAGLAVDQAQARPAASHDSALESTQEEDEDRDGVANGHAPAINVSNEDGEDLSEFDFTKSLRVRTLFAYEGQREVDLSFKENVAIVAHPAKDESSPWWYGMLVEEGRKGWFPHSYVEQMTVTRAKASYAFDGGSDDQLPFAEGDILEVVDTSDPNWWKTEKAGVIFIVPASYLEIIDTEPRSDWIVPLPSQPPIRSQQHVHLHPEPPPQSLATQDLRPRLETTLSTVIPINAPPDSPSLNSDESSDDDSVLSWWSSDEDESDIEVDGEKEAERKRREAERQKILSSAGLQLRREPPGVPNRSADRRRPAPIAPKRKRRQAPAIPAIPSSHETPPAVVVPPQEQTQDAYARYESFLAQANSAPRSNELVQVPSGHSPSVAFPQISEPGATTLSPTASSLSLGKEKEHGGSRITGFFSRMMAPTTSHDKKESTSRISGPITRVDTPISSRGGEGEGEGFGKTWSSLVDPGVLESMGGKERKRQEAIFEFVATESGYNRDLQLIVEVFYAPLLPLLVDKALAVIFANVEDILLANTAFLSSLEQRQRNCRLYVDTVGDILEEHMPAMGIYTTYCVNQQQASRLLQSLRQSNAELATHLQNIRETNQAARGLDLSSFLLIPMQRITRYPLLLKQIINYTEADQDLHLIQNALNTVESIVGTINESVREAEGQDRLRVLSEDLWIGGEGRLDLTAPTQYQGPRRLLKEGVVMKAKSGRRLAMVLCTDVLVLIEERNLYRMPIPLFDITIRPGGDESSFGLKVGTHRGGDTVRLKTSSGREAKEWVGMIEGARLRSVDARKMGGD